MSNEQKAKAFLSQIGFKDNDIDKEYETDFVPAKKHAKGGVIFVEYSGRFSSFTQIVKHIEKELKIKANVIQKGSEVDFDITNQYFNYMVIYKEKDINKIYLQKKVKDKIVG